MSAHVRWKMCVQNINMHAVQSGPEVELRKSNEKDQRGRDRVMVMCSIKILACVPFISQKPESQKISTEARPLVSILFHLFIFSIHLGMAISTSRNVPQSELTATVDKKRGNSVRHLAIWSAKTILPRTVGAKQDQYTSDEDSRWTHVFLESSQILPSLGELSLFHTFTDKPMDEGTLAVEQVEFVIKARPGRSNGGSVAERADGTRDLGEITAWDLSRWLVADTELETGSVTLRFSKGG